MRGKKTIFHQFLSISIGSWTALIVGVISTPITTRLISPDQYGKISLFTVAVDILSILALLGADQAYSRFYYETKNKRGLVAKCTMIALSSLIVVLAGIVLGKQKFLRLVFGDQRSILLLLTSLYLILRVISTFVSVTVRIQQKGRLFSLIQVLNKVLEFAGIVAFACFLGNTFEVIIYAHLFFMLTVTVIIAWFYRHSFNMNALNLNRTPNTKTILIYSVPMMITQLVILIFQSIDKLSINAWTSVTQVGLYAAAFKIIALINMVQINFTAFWTPVSYEKYISEPENKFFFREMFDYIAVLMLNLSLGVLLFKQVIVLLLGSAYQHSVLIIPFLIFVPLMYTCSEITGVGINFLKKAHLHIWIASAALLLAIGLNFWLVPALGAIGAAVSMGSTYIVFFIMRTVISQRNFPIPFRLKRFYLFVGLLWAYAFTDVFMQEPFVHWGFGCFVLCWLNFSYHKTLVTIVKKMIGTFIK